MRFLENIAHVRLKSLKLWPYDTIEIDSILYSIWFRESGLIVLLDSELALFLIRCGYVNRYWCIVNLYVLHDA